MKYLLPFIRIAKKSALATVLMVAAINVIAEEEAIKPDVITSYVKMTPAFVSNVASTDGRLHYVKADIALMVRGNATVDAVTYHDHLLKNKLVMIMSGQEFATLSTGEGQTALRSEVLDELVSVLEDEEAPNDILDVLFTNFLIE